MGAIVAPKGLIRQKRRAALPWVAGAISLVVHAGVVVALVADPVTPPAPLPMITLELTPSPPGKTPGSATARNARDANAAAATRPAAKVATVAKPVPPPAADKAPAPAKPAVPAPVARPTRVVPDAPKPVPVAAPDIATPDMATPKVSPPDPATSKAPPTEAATAKAPPVTSAPVKAAPKRAEPATAKPLPAKRVAGAPPKSPAARPTTPRRAARKTNPVRRARTRTATATRPVAGRQAAALPGPNETYTPPRHGAGGGVNRPPAYPHRARRLGWQGRVVVRVRVDPRGRVAAVRLGQSSGHDLLDRAALDAVRQWRFAPATRGANPVAAWVDVPVRFRLTDGS